MQDAFVTPELMLLRQREISLDIYAFVLGFRDNLYCIRVN